MKHAAITIAVVVAMLAVATIAFLIGKSFAPTARQTPQTTAPAGHEGREIAAMPGMPGMGEMRGLRDLTLTPEAVALAEIETAPVRREFVQSEIRLVGKIAFDETRLTSITARVPGRLDRLYVDYTGILVTKGDHMVYLYSPELLVAQEELIQAVRSGDQASIDAVRGKLRLWNLTDEQIADMEKLKTPSDHITIYAPVSGVVIKKNALEGTYVDTGTEIYTIADLSQVWVMLDAYESDLVWIRYGQKIEFQAEAYPGTIYTGRISFISPTLDDMTRTVKVRVDVPNQDGKLKPEMFVHAIVRAKVAGEGQVIDPDLVGKWICPMHPQIIKDEPGKCPLCGMTLVTAESLGYLPVKTVEPPLVIPATAPLITGRRAVVYVADPASPGTFHGREILLGPRSGDFYIVRNGLSEGERVVTRGNFKIDSALQIEAKPSAMSPEGAPGAGMAGMEGMEMGPVPGMEGGAAMEMAPHEFVMMLDPVYAAYFKVHAALARDDLDAAKGGWRDLSAAIAQVKTDALPESLAPLWNDLRMRLSDSSVDGSEAKTLGDAREILKTFSEEILQLDRSFSHADDKPHYLMRSKEAFGGAGASWLQETDAPLNPYLSGDMRTSGEMRETLNPMKMEMEQPPKPSEKPAETPLAFKKQMTALLDAYLEIDAALVQSDKDKAAAAATKFSDALKAVDMGLLKDDAAMAAWMNDGKKLQDALDAFTKADKIDGQRAAFADLSATMAEALKALGYAREKPVTQFHCAMAKADWLQEGEDVKNPYFSEPNMSQCGEKVQTIPATAPADN
jgi:Cu(I)/Ag(I) efflux system membrane fusion protein